MKLSGKDIVRKYIEAINSHNIQAMRNLMTLDHTFIDAEGKEMKGREKILDGWPAYYDMFPDFKIKIESIIEDGSIVAVFGSTFATYNGKTGMKPENKICEPAAWKAVVKNQKLASWQVYTDYTKTWKVINENQ